MENAKKMFLFNLLLTAVIAFTSLYLIKKVNKIVTIEKFAYGSGSSASYAPLMKVDKEDFEDEKETTKKVDTDNTDSTDSTDNTVKKDSCKPCPINNTNRNEQILKGFGNQDVDTLFGTPTHYSEASASYSNTQENAPNVKGDKKSLFLFKYNDCKPECCEPSSGKGTGYSCDTGCVCYDKEQNNLVASRGDGIYPSNPDGSLKFQPYQKII
tara:strand:- start:2975 stop:3610 length:636 start_codon:yes stop_codon:yes gene_type:complete